METSDLNEQIMKRKIGMAESGMLTDAQAVINQKLYALDIVAHKMTLKWGWNRLADLAPEGLRDKWNNQVSKLNAAVADSNVLLVEELIEGCIRGWAALERAAVVAGHVPFEPMVWEVLVEGVVYQVVKSNEDAHALASRSVPERPVVTLEELVRVYHARHTVTFAGGVSGGSLGIERVPDPSRGMNEVIPF